MGIISRFKDIMTSNINALLDKCEDPEKMIDQYLRDLESDLGKVKAETASIMADETRSKRELDECSQEIDKLKKYAEKALLAGNEADAKTFLEKKQMETTKRVSLEETSILAGGNAQKMCQMHDKLVKDIEELDARRDAIKAKVKVAKTQDRINKIGSSMDNVGSKMDAFSRMEAKADKMLDEANAMAELNQSNNDTDINSLAARYDTAGDSAVEDELAALKVKMGL